MQHRKMKTISPPRSAMCLVPSTFDVPYARNARKSVVAPMPKTAVPTTRTTINVR